MGGTVGEPFGNGVAVVGGVGVAVVGVVGVLVGGGVTVAGMGLPLMTRKSTSICTKPSLGSLFEMQI